MPIPAGSESASIITTDDLAPFANIETSKAQAMISTALARAARVAPCINDSTLSVDHAEAFKGILRDAILRWNEAGSGALQQQSAGPFGMTVDTRTPRRGLFWPSEIDEMQAICKDHAGVESSTGAFSITPSGSTAVHMPWCAINFGATYCSCGADIAGTPIYEA